MKPTSVRARTTTTAVVAFSIAVALAALGLIATLQSSLMDEIDRSLDSRAADIAAQVDSENELIVLGAGIDSDTLAVVFSLDGALFDSTDLSVDLDVLGNSFEETDAPFDADLNHLADTAGAGNMRAVVLSVPLDPTTATEFVADDDFLILVATSLDGFDRTVNRVTLVALAIGPLLVVLVGALTWVLTGRSLAPVEAIRSEVDAITDSELDRRVTPPKSSDEIARLAKTMNEMLERLDSASTSQRRFIADASHELRSPLASIAARIDVSLRHGTDEEWRSTASAVRNDVDRMHRLVDDLLHLARSDTEASDRANGTAVDLDDIVLSVIGTTIRPSHVALDASAVSAGLVSGHPDHLTRVVTNLIDNAVRHARSQVTISLSDDTNHVTLTIDDDGVGVAPADRSRIFDRFVRLDDARDRDSGGAGLGLAISRDIVQRHAGNIDVDEAPGGGARFAVSLPSRAS